MVETRNDIRTRYLINDTCVLAEREPKTAARTNGVNFRGGGPIPMVSGRAMGTEGKLTVCNHMGVCDTNDYTRSSTL